MVGFRVKASRFSGTMRVGRGKEVMGQESRGSGPEHMREGCLGHGCFRIFLTRTTIPEDVHPEHRGTEDQATEQDRYQHPSASCPLSAPFSGKPFFWRTLVGETNKTNKFGRDRDDKMMRTGHGG